MEESFKRCSIPVAKGHVSFAQRKIAKE